MSRVNVILHSLAFLLVLQYAQGQAGGPIDLLEEPKLLIEFEPSGGFFDAPQMVKLISNEDRARIYYTTDGSEPNKSSGKLYKGPFELDETTCVRAIAIKGTKKTKIKAHTYF